MCDSCKSIISYIEQLSGLDLNNVFLKVNTEKCKERLIAVGDLVKSTLGPKNKILQCNINGEPDADKLLITNDRATILSKIGVDNLVERVLVVQDDEVGDGTTSVVETENLLAQKIHLQTITTGWRNVTNEALMVLEDVANNNRFLISSNLQQFKSDLMNIARTTLGLKIFQEKKDHFSKLCVDPVLKLHDKTDSQDIQTPKGLGSNLNDSHLEEGFLSEKRICINMPKRIENAPI
ncbi:unnamed protein product [Rotaria sordida]|uniref:Uncharacterized protein n=2 Tax=Rotaria sordida TaxID=392033 RepID=A0A819HVY3_9BILA|nr:unnamed protein product [Rotaria sordida]